MLEKPYQSRSSIKLMNLIYHEISPLDPMSIDFFCLILLLSHLKPNLYKSLLHNQWDLTLNHLRVNIHPLGSPIDELYPKQTIFHLPSMEKA